MKRTVLVLAMIAVIGLPTAYGSKPFESHFTIGAVEGEVDDVLLPSGVLKEKLISIRYPIDGDWVGDWEHSGFLTANPNGTFFAFGKGSFSGRILAPDGTWYTGTVEFVAHTTGKIGLDGSFLDMWTQWTILSGTGELENLRGHGVEDTDGHDTAWLHFEPQKIRS